MYTLLIFFHLSIPNTKISEVLHSQETVQKIQDT